jgi:hypothetical protein
LSFLAVVLLVGADHLADVREMVRAGAGDVPEVQEFRGLATPRLHGDRQRKTG